MADEKWSRVREIFDNVLRQKEKNREKYLTKVCGEDKALLDEVRSLLSSLGKAESFMEENAVAYVADVISGEKENLEGGKCFGHYEIVRQIGAGGMGEVFLAKDKKLDRPVAIKILNGKIGEQESNLRRFTREAKAASALNHPNILVIHEIGESEGANYIVSEYVEGETLREHIGKSPMKLSKVLDISIQLANALKVAHTARIIHRDIKPENIMLHPDGYLKILDFGLAKLVEQKALVFEEESVKQNETTKGVIIGTVNYMSPEQAKGEDLDERTDIFSLGAVIYEMVTGRMPFAGNSMSETFANVINSEPQPFSNFSADASDELQRIVNKTLSKNKDERYQTMKSLLADLSELRESLTLDERLGKSSSRATKSADKQSQGTAGKAIKQTAETHYSFSQKIKNHQPVAALALIVLFISAVGLSFYFFKMKKTTLSSTGKKTIAVLPFVNVNQDANSDYLSDGITENVINKLSQLSGLKVMAKNSVYRFKNKEIEPKKIADELGVQTLLTGDVKQDGNRLVINIHLIDPNDGSQIWGKQFVKNASDLIATQSEIAQLVAQNLRSNLTDAEKQQIIKHPTENEEAYRLYLKGQFFGQQNTPDALNKSIEYYRQAVEKDPEFALAYSEMGMRYINLGIYFFPPPEVMPKARANAEKALEIDPALSDPHTILGVIALLYDWDWDKADKELTESNIVNLNSIETFSCSAHILHSTGRAPEADEDLRRALENDPLSISLNTELGCNSYYAGRNDESIGQYREAIILEPRNFMALYGLARSLNHKKQYQEAIDEIETAKNFMPMLPPIAVAEEGYAYAKMGRRVEAEKELRTLKEASQKIYVDPFFIATVYLGMDDRDQSIEWLEKASAAKSSLTVSLINDAKWDDLRQDERFKAILHRLSVS